MLRWLQVLTLVGCGFSNRTTGVEVDAKIEPTGQVTRLVDVADTKVTGGPHAEFPLVVSATIAAADPQAFDVWFSVDKDGAMRLAHDIERYDAATGALVAWVKIPQLVPTTTFYLHYGDDSITASQEMKEAVWSAGFAAVWHMGDMSDVKATSNATNSNTTTADGQLAAARAFDGVNAFMNVGSAPTIDNIFGGGGGTFEAWFYATTFGPSGLGRLFDKQSTIIAMCGAGAGIQISRYFDQSGFATWCTGASTVPLAAWTHLAVVYDEGSIANDPIVYINGATVAAPVQANPMGSAQNDNTNAASIGDRIAGGMRAFNGRIDEVRVTKGLRSAAWIATAYENERDPAAFCVVAAP